MTVNEVPLEALEQTWAELLDRLHTGFTADERAFLHGALTCDNFDIDHIRAVDDIRFAID